MTPFPLFVSTTSTPFRVSKISRSSRQLQIPKCQLSSPQPKPSYGKTWRTVAAIVAAIATSNIRPIPLTHSAQIQHSTHMSSTIYHKNTSRNISFATVSVTAPNPTIPKSNLTGIRVILPTRADPVIHKALKYALLAGIATVIILAVTIAIFWVIQDGLVYKPTKVWRGTPKSAGMPHYEDVKYNTIDGVEITGWFIRQPPQSFNRARTLIYFHGTDKNASFRLKKVVGLYEQCNCNILLVSYRGYGLSTGKPNERGVKVDAESAYHYLKSRGDVDVSPGGKLWVYGESLGGAVAVHFCDVYQDCINALILENTFTSLLDMAKLEFPMLGVFRFLGRNRWQSKHRIGNLNIPLLFLSGLKDAYIPPEMMKKMYTLATGSPMKEMIEFKNGTHNRTWAMKGFFEGISQFMDRVDSGNQSKELLVTGTSQTSSGRLDEGGNVATAV